MRCFKDGYATILKIGIGIAAATESHRYGDFYTDLVSKIVSSIVELVVTFTTSLSKIIETIQAVNNRVSVIPKNSLLFVSDGINEIFKIWPKSRSKNGLAQSLYQEFLVVLETLAKIH